MIDDYSHSASAAGSAPKNLRSARIDDIDRILLSRLEQNARISNSALAEHAGIAASTCLGRVRSLVERGVIRGFHADIAPEALGRELQAMIAVRLKADARTHMASFAERMAELETVLSVYFIAGPDDYLLHIAARDTAELRDVVVAQLNSHPDVASTETIL